MKTEVDVVRLRSELDALHDTRSSINRLIEHKELLMLKTLANVHGFETIDAVIGALAQFASKDLRGRIGPVGRSPLRESECAGGLAHASGRSLTTTTRRKGLSKLDVRRGLSWRTGASAAEQGSPEGTTVRTGQTKGSTEDWAL